MEKIKELLKTPLISSILLFILGAILFTNPGNIVKFVTYAFGGLFLLLGFIKLATYLGDKKKDIINNNNLIYAITMFALGIIVILCSSIIEQVIRIIMGGYILYNGIIRLTSSLKSDMWKGNVVISIIIILVGLYIILVSNLVFSGIGLVIMIYSLLEIILFITNNKEKNVIIK